MAFVLVTGASGFIGRALTLALVAGGFRVRAACRQPSVLDSRAGVEGVELPDLAGPVDWDELLADVDFVVHLAGIAHSSGIADADYDRVITRATHELAQSCSRRGISHLVFVSSILAQSGSAADYVVTEDISPQPATPYGRAKLAAEMAIKATTVPFTILRPAPVYGPGAKGNIAILLRIASLPVPLPFSSLKNRRSLVGVDNLVEAVIFCLSNPNTIGQTYVVADREPIRLFEIFANMRAAEGRRADLVSFPVDWIGKVLRALGRGALWDRVGRDFVIDPQKLLAAGWRPVVDTQAGLREMVRAHNGPKR